MELVEHIGVELVVHSTMKTCAAIIARLRSHADPVNAAGMARFGISKAGTLGVSVPLLRQITKEVGHNHKLAIELWDSGIHEARVLTAFIGSAKDLDEATMERLALETDSWDICDQLCGELFAYHEQRFIKAAQWAERPEEFVKRCGFVLMARLAVRDKKAADEAFISFLPLIEKHATDERNMVRKAVNWALRQIGKRNLRLHALAIECGERIKAINNKTARWIAGDALRELRNPEIIGRIKG